MARFRLDLAAALVLAATVAACGGGGVAGTPVASGAAGSQSSASNAVALNGAAGSRQIIALPAFGGYGGTLSLTFANPVSGVPAVVSLGTQPPAGVPAPTGADEPVAFAGLNASANVAIAGVPGFSFTVPASAVQSARRSARSGTASLLLSVFDPAHAAAGFQSRRRAC